MATNDIKQAIFDARGRTGFHIDVVQSRDKKLFQVRIWRNGRALHAVPDVISDPLTADELILYLAAIEQ